MVETSIPPKEKALALVWEYYHRLEHTLNDDYAPHDWSLSKDCAVTLVDEILITLNRDLRDIDVVGNSLLELIDYWKEVKTEIEKL